MNANRLVKSAIRFFYPDAFPVHKVTLKEGVARFVSVRFFLPGEGSVVQIYDREIAGDVSAWDQNQAIYRCQVQGFASTREALAGSDLGDAR